MINCGNALSLKTPIIHAIIPGEESVKRFERSNGLDTALYKTIPLPLPLFQRHSNVL